MTSHKRPGVAINTSGESRANAATSLATSVPPVSNIDTLSFSESSSALLNARANGAATACICAANSRVGDTINAPTSCLFIVFTLRHKISTMGSTNARVLPLPVHASTATSLCEHSRGIVAACTGVARTNPSASSVASERASSAGVSALNDGPSGAAADGSLARMTIGDVRMNGASTCGGWEVCLGTNDCARFANNTNDNKTTCYA